jgi:hypothetical protein
MNVSLEFTITLADCLQLASARQSRLSLMVRRAIAAFVLLLSFRHLLTNGLDWEFALYVVVAIYIVTPAVTALLIAAIWRPILHVSIDDDTVSVESKRHKQNIPWDSFATFGTASEFTNHFWLECGRGTVWVPKRAFSTTAEIVAFRRFVRDKMGDRFNTSQLKQVQPVVSAKHSQD